MSTETNSERFNKICKNIQIRAVKLKDHYERIRLVGWLKKLRECEGVDYPDPNLREIYVRAILHNLEHEGTFKAPPFDKAPPLGPLPSFPSMLADKLRHSKILYTETGQLSPILEHKSPDGRAIISAKRTDNGSLLCYLSVSRN